MTELSFPLPSATVAMLLADARLPSGGHAHSAGLEPALRAGLPVRDVPDFLLARARSTGVVEAGTAVVARHLALVEPVGLESVVHAWSARTPSNVLRDAARHLGRGYLRLAGHLWPSSTLLAELASWPRPAPRAIVLGVIAAESGMDPRDLVRLAIYDETASAAAALLKLEPRDPAEVTGWVVHVCTVLDDAVEDIAALVDPAAIPAAGAPQAEGWAQAHALLSQRLFRA
ncbi:urease accessory protein UreF [Gordonia effusa NBRC 100432]|uniref:Urease accessory protein UreF n=1 Tax=Gordonia effusa NBRC 100432 TaxID=1077974 RepID=H0R447_9ACTN|nr:urease accessory UreF family protein [Gordonia effusa]GAB19848.1 urease accessory protein UreF [Gordonia effusa NBRC 100432]